MKLYRKAGLVALFLAVSMVTACGQAATPAELSSVTSSEISVSQPDAPTTIPLSYTEEYLLFEGDELGYTTYDGATGYYLGLMSSDGREILPAAYNEISVSQEGLIFVSEVTDPNKPTKYKMFDLDGNQIGRDYSFIESVSMGSEGVYVERHASSTDMAAVPPYIASIENGNGKRSYWLLDSKGIPVEEQPYDSMLISADDGSVVMARDGYRYVKAPDGSVTVSGNEVVESCFGGKYVVKDYLGAYAADLLLSLWDEQGNMIAPPEYARIAVPFEDRYILYTGSPQFTGGMQGFLYDDSGKLLADNSNQFSFTVEPDGRYVGISYVGNPYDGYVDIQILDKDGKPEPQGIYFVDKNGKWLSEGYKDIEFYKSEEELQDRAGEGQIIRYSKIDGYDKPLPKGDPNAPFYLCMTQQDKLVRLAYKELLLKQ